MAGLQTKAQSSLEYMLIIAVTFAMVVPTTYIFYNYSKESTDELVDAQIEKIGRSLVDTAESIYYGGVGSKTIIDIIVPGSIASAQIIDGRELVFNVTTNYGTSEVVFFSKANLTTKISNCANNGCSLPGLVFPGSKKVKIESIDKNHVSIETI